MNEEDQNPMLPNLRDECLSGMNSVVKGIFIGFAICVAAVIAWFFFLVTRPAKVVEEHATHYPKWEDASGFTIITNHQPTRWFSFTYTDNNPHWTNVVFSSTREPVVTKTNGEWRIGFK